MHIATQTEAIPSYRLKATMWLNLTALVIIPPFAIHNFIQQRYLVSTLTFLVVGILLVQAWTTYRGRHYPLVTAAGFVPANILVLAVCYQHQGIIGALWCYPSLLGFYFLLPLRQAICASICLLAVATPMAWLFLEPYLAVRVAITLLAVGIFSAIFLWIIEQQQRELKQKEHQRRDGMASASHEIRTPLFTIMAQIEAMRDGIRPLNQDQLTSLSGSVDHLNGLVDDLFLLSLADVSALSCERAPVRLDLLVQESVAAAASKLSDRQISIVNSMNEPITVDGDAKRLRQIIDNVLANCYSYTSSSGRITIAATCKHDSVELTVTDTGPGVSDSALHSLFDRFFQLDPSRSPSKDSGTGMGLSLVKALVEVHEGQVKAFHSPEGGLGISISLPLVLNGAKSEL